MKNRYIKLRLVIIIIASLCGLSSCEENGSSSSQDTYQGILIDTVYKFIPGEGQSFGQADEYYPMNIFSGPDKNARHNFGSANPNEILSLGLGGEIIVGFKDRMIINGPGLDFCVFENAFMNIITENIFVEPARIGVSRNGIEYTFFPYDKDTFDGCAGITPVNGDRNTFDPSLSGGDIFDLESIGMDSIRYIKIIDISRILLENPNHPLYDPTITGFDLDAVAAYFFVEM